MIVAEVNKVEQSAAEAAPGGATTVAEGHLVAWAGKAAGSYAVGRRARSAAES